MAAAEGTAEGLGEDHRVSISDFHECKVEEHQIEDVT